MKKKLRTSLYIFSTLGLMSCASSKMTAEQGKQVWPAFSTEAHRGGRGLMPENTIPAMLDAVDRGVTTLEMDLGVTRDGKVIVTHDSYVNLTFVTPPKDAPITAAEGRNLFWYSMDYAVARQYETGLKKHPLFPQQKKIETHIPLFEDLIDAVETHARKRGKRMFYNVEIKSQEGGDGTKHPAVAEFSDLVVAVLKKKNIGERTIVQSFDVRAIKYLHNRHPEFKVSYLADKKSAGQYRENLAQLGFKPDVYSPEQSTVDATMVATCHEMGIKVIPWTANTKEDIKRLMALGVDGIITDYPDLLLRMN